MNLRAEMRSPMLGRRLRPRLGERNNYQEIDFKKGSSDNKWKKESYSGE